MCDSGLASGFGYRIPAAYYISFVVHFDDRPTPRPLDLQPLLRHLSVTVPVGQVLRIRRPGEVAGPVVSRILVQVVDDSLTRRVVVRQPGHGHQPMHQKMPVDNATEAGVDPIVARWSLLLLDLPAGRVRTLSVENSAILCNPQPL